MYRGQGAGRWAESSSGARVLPYKPRLCLHSSQEGRAGGDYVSSVLALPYCRCYRCGNDAEDGNGGGEGASADGSDSPPPPRVCRHWRGAARNIAGTVLGAAVGVRLRFGRDRRRGKARHLGPQRCGQKTSGSVAGDAASGGRGCPAKRGAGGGGEPCGAGGTWGGLVEEWALSMRCGCWVRHKSMRFGFWLKPRTSTCTCSLRCAALCCELSLLHLLLLLLLLLFIMPCALCLLAPCPSPLPCAPLRPPQVSHEEHEEALERERKAKEELEKLQEDWSRQAEELEVVQAEQSRLHAQSLHLQHGLMTAEQERQVRVPSLRVASWVRAGLLKPIIGGG